MKTFGNPAAGEMEEWMKQFTTPHSLEPVIPICQCQKTHDEGARKSIWADTPAHKEISQAIFEAVVKEGGIQKHGAALTDAQRRKLTKLLKNSFKDAGSDSSDEE